MKTPAGNSEKMIDQRDLLPFHCSFNVHPLDIDPFDPLNPRSIE